MAASGINSEHSGTFPVGKFRTSPLTFILVIYLGIGLLLLPVYQFQINPDGISYLNIAENYARGNVREAVNAYWGPLISWLTVPFLRLGVPGQIAVKLVLLGGGAIALGGVWRLLGGFGMTDFRRWATVGAAVPMTLYFALWVITPDLLVAAALLWYLSIPFDLGKKLTFPKALVWGGLGAVAYFAKSFAFPFVFLHFPLSLALRLVFKVETLRESVRKGAAGFAVFLLASGVWVGCLHAKYRTLTFGSSGRMNHIWFGPNAPPYPTERGFGAPPTRFVTSAWEDPTDFSAPDWSPLESKANFVFQLRATGKYLKLMVVESLPSFSILAPFLLIGLSLWAAAFRRISGNRRAVTLILATIFLYMGGYSLVYVETRHLWLLAFLFLILVPFACDLGEKEVGSIRGTRIRRLALLAGLATFSISPVPEVVSAVRGADADLTLCRNLFNGASELRRNFGVTGRIASNANWHYSLYLAYFMKSQYLGAARPEASYDQIRNDLTRLKADYFFVWADEKGNFEPVPFGKEITGGSVAGLRIYRLAS